MDYSLLLGDCKETLKTLPAGSVQCVVTSPPFFQLRDYNTGEWEGGDDECDHLIPRGSLNTGFNERFGKPSGERKQEGMKEEQFQDRCLKCGAFRTDAQIGLEDSPQGYVDSMVEVFREVWRVLRDDGVVWLNLGDCYAGGAGGRSDSGRSIWGAGTHTNKHDGKRIPRKLSGDLKVKDLIGIPWMVAFALRDEGWYLRQSIVWAKPNCMPESVKDRCTRSHEMIFMFSKQSQYYYDHHAIKEPIGDSMKRSIEKGPRITEGYKHDSDTRMGKSSGNHAFSRRDSLDRIAAGRNKRDVWTVPPSPYPDAHFAVYPPDLIEPCILAGTSAKGCCADCGAPWERQVSRQATPQDSRLVQVGGMEISHPNPKRGGQRVTSSGTVPSYQAAEKETMGWVPSCGCLIGPTKPCVVLDPFGGSGTTAGVALKHGRNAILCELNAEYAELIPSRIQAISQIATLNDEREWL